jgi:hypothetical protein
LAMRFSETAWGFGVGQQIKLGTGLANVQIQPRRKAVKDGPWIAVAREAASRAQFRPVETPLQGEAFCLPGEVCPSVQVFFQKITRSEIAPDAWLGLYVPEFERDWRERLPSGPLKSLPDEPPLGVLAANIERLRPRPWVAASPTAQGVAAVGEWLDRAFECAATFPTNMPSLIETIRRNNIAGFELWALHGHPVKVRGFAGWLRRTHGVDLSESLLRGIDSRVEPYDASVMLDSPERDALCGGAP